MDTPSKITLEELVRFQQELESLARSGLPIAEGLRRAARDTAASESFRRLTDSTATGLEQGKPLSQALEQSGVALPALMLRVVRAAEATGGLAPLLGELVRDGNREQLFRSNLRTTFSYPLVILVFGTALFGAIYSVVLPRIHQTLGRVLESSAPVHRIIADYAVLSHAHLYIVLPVLVLVGAFLLHRLSRLPRVANVMLSVGLRLPYLGPFILMHHAHLWCRSLSHLLRGGIPLDESLELVADLLPHQVGAQATREAAGRLRRGGRLAGTLSANHILPPAFEWSIARAEERGDLVAMLSELAELAETKREIHRQRVLLYLEPLLLVFLGALIGLLIIMVYFPILQIPRLV